jgi:hypothetical protein
MAEIRFTNLEEVAKKFGFDVVNGFIQRLNASKKKASGDLINSIKYNLKEVDGEIEVQITALDYLTYVDKGRKPGSFAPVSALKKWAARKGMPESAVYAINKKIYKKGIPAANIILPVVSQRKSVINQEVEKAFKADMENYFYQLSQEIK